MYRGVQARLGLQRGVLVQSAVYAEDLSCAKAALEQSAGQLRGVALLAPEVTHAHLTHLDQLGFRGVRINFVDRGGTWEQARSIAAKIAPFGWHLECLIGLERIAELRNEIAHLPVPVVIDHLGYRRAEDSLRSEALGEFLALLAGGRVWTKVSGVDRIGNRAKGYDDAGELVRRVVAANPSNVMWGSDWPHLGRRNLPDDVGLLDLLGQWIPDADTRCRILVDNPQRLYRF
jgi:predicted TIM-barrel fold metal-dependent hydrolase